eukprot:TRINITY_DN1367_c0_g1_i1.p1 TRINITY_DN1367_c0_g1~~TRINITY_DN1367_c0_g1_i1.p1  ORF type:complete len:124 (+),score=15.56 TRINITY_DN1367_c0_g1_i1:63-434(+)
MSDDNQHERHETEPSRQSLFSRLTSAPFLAASASLSFVMGLYKVGQLVTLENWVQHAILADKIDHEPSSREKAVFGSFRLLHGSLVCKSPRDSIVFLQGKGSVVWHVAHQDQSPHYLDRYSVM